MADLPIVCTLQPGDLNARAAELLLGIAALALGRSSMENGLRLELPATDEALSAAIAMIRQERRCCRFLRFQLTVEPHGGPVTLEMTGPPGTATFLAGLVDAA